MIKAIILDIDGVIVGSKHGINFPNPHSAVIEKLKKIKKQGIPVCLCTYKPYFSILNIIKSAGLDNYHMTQGGAVIVNPLDHSIIQKNVMDAKVVAKLIDLFIKNNIYTECYTAEDYFVEESQKSEITDIHTKILQREPVFVKSLRELTSKSDIVRVMPIVKGKAEYKRLTNLLEPFKKQIYLAWGAHPVAMHLEFGLITAPGVTKELGALQLSKSMGVPLENILGVGDTMADWEFIRLCGYGAAMGNAKSELKEMVLTKDEGRSFIAPTVDENGILKVFDYFSI